MMINWIKRLIGLENKRKGTADVFCMMPWVHFHVTQLGTVTPCCQAPWQEETAFGNINRENIAQIWNGKKMAAFRKNMKNGVPDKRCEGCYEKEKQGFTSLRQITNKNYFHHYDRVNQTLKDGQIPGTTPVYFDIRFSNVCNLRCRICGPWSSSSWHNDAVALGMKSENAPAITVSVHNTERLFSELEGMMPDMEEFYFAGGEPLVTEEHYRLLDMLIKHGKTDVKLTYNTNFSSFEYKGVNVLELWKKFRQVNIAASLDAEGMRGELLRKNLDWTRVEDNRLKLLKELPHAEFTVSPTLNVYNLLHLPDFHRNWTQRGLIGVEDFIPTLLIKPNELAVSALTYTVKKQALGLYKKHLEWIAQQTVTKPEKYEHMISQFKNVMIVLNAKGDKNIKTRLKQHVNSLDSLRNENTLKVFPELGNREML